MTPDGLDRIFAEAEERRQGGQPTPSLSDLNLAASAMAGTFNGFTANLDAFKGSFRASEAEKKRLAKDAEKRRVEEAIAKLLNQGNLAPPQGSTMSLRTPKPQPTPPSQSERNIFFGDKKLRLSKEEAEGVRKFLDALQCGVWVKCSKCRKFSGGGQTVTISNGKVYCEDCY